MINTINWLDPKAKVTENFTVRELCWLPSWGIMHQPNEEEQANLLKLANKMEEIREFIGKAINVHVAIRPSSVNCPGSGYHGRNYNSSVGGAPNSAHQKGLAMDLNFYSMTCDEARYILERELIKFDLYMERKPGSSWVHLNLEDGVKRSNRYFIP